MRSPEDAPSGPSGAWLTTASIQDEIVSQSIDAIVITDVERLIRVWNPAAERLYGIPAADAVGRAMDELVETLDASSNPIDSTTAREELQSSGTWRRRVVQRTLIGERAGASVLVDSLVTLLRGSDGERVGALGVNRDLSATARL